MRCSAGGAEAPVVQVAAVAAAHHGAVEHSGRDAGVPELQPPEEGGADRRGVPPQQRGCELWG